MCTVFTDPNIPQRKQKESERKALDDNSMFDVSKIPLSSAAVIVIHPRIRLQAKVRKKRKPWGPFVSLRLWRDYTGVRASLRK